MARLFGLIGNRADLAGRVLGFESEALRVRSHESQLGWGLGFYQGGEVLMRRRPIDDKDVDLAKLASDVRADVLLGHVRSATVGALRTENTHPFRYRQWLFAQTGTINHFETVRDRLVESVPEFLRGGIRGETDSEIFFHIFLSFLHDAGRLNDFVVEANIVREALRSSIALIDRMTSEVAEKSSELASVNFMVTNGEYMIAGHRSQKMAYRVFSGFADADMIFGDDTHLSRRMPELAQMHFVLMASDFDSEPPSNWKPVADRAIVTVTRGHEPKIETL